MKILHIIASPRLESSATLQISRTLLDALTDRFPDAEVEELDLFQADLPAIAGDNIESKYNLILRRPIDRSHADSWSQIETEIERFRSADAYVISAPMWNFGVPYALKYYIDCIVQPGYLFQFNEQGIPLPLVHDKKMVVALSSGSDYSKTSGMHALNFHEPYLRTIFGFAGITDITYINAFSLDVSPELRASSLAAAFEQAHEEAHDDGWLSLTEVAA